MSGETKPVTISDYYWILDLIKAKSGNAPPRATPNLQRGEK
jgi:hypothetical protein